MSSPVTCNSSKFSTASFKYNRAFAGNVLTVAQTDIAGDTSIITQNFTHGSGSPLPAASALKICINGLAVLVEVTNVTAPNFEFTAIGGLHDPAGQVPAGSLISVAF